MAFPKHMRFDDFTLNVYIINTKDTSTGNFSFMTGKELLLLYKQYPLARKACSVPLFSHQLNGCTVRFALALSDLMLFKPL